MLESFSRTDRSLPNEIPWGWRIETQIDRPKAKTIRTRSVAFQNAKMIFRRILIRRVPVPGRLAAAPPAA